MARTSICSKGEMGAHTQDILTQCVGHVYRCWNSSFVQAPYSQHSHHKSQTFIVQKGYALEQPGISTDPDLLPRPQQITQDASEQKENSRSAVPTSSRAPKWIENDGKASIIRGHHAASRLVALLSLFLTKQS